LESEAVLDATRKVVQVLGTDHAVAQVDDDWCEQVGPINAPLGASILVIILHGCIEHIEFEHCESAAALDVLALAAHLAPATRSGVLAVAEAFAPYHIRLVTALIACENRHSHRTPTDFSDAPSNQIFTQRAEVALVRWLINQLARHDPLLEQLCRAAIANAPDCEREAAHRVSSDAVVLQTARRTSERENRATRPFIRRTDAQHDLLSESVLLVRALRVLRRHELPDVQRHPLLRKRHLLAFRAEASNSTEFFQTAPAQ
jgi:hypothetical protein